MKTRENLNCLEAARKHTDDMIARARANLALKKRLIERSKKSALRMNAQQRNELATAALAADTTARSVGHALSIEQMESIAFNLCAYMWVAGKLAPKRKTV